MMGIDDLELLEPEHAAQLENSNHVTVNLFRV